MSPALVVSLVALGAFALMLLAGWLEYRRICKADAERRG
jgi:hypothetical protein